MVDYGYLTVVQTDLQRTADGAALAGVMDLIPNDAGFQNYALAKETARNYANYNMGYQPQYDSSTGDMAYPFTVLDDDIVTGKYNPATVNGTGTLGINTSTSVIHDTMRVTVRRDTHRQFTGHAVLCSSDGNSKPGCDCDSDRRAAEASFSSSGRGCPTVRSTARILEFTRCWRRLFRSTMITVIEDELR